jgi:hypothetical protein
MRAKLVTRALHLVLLLLCVLFLPPNAVFSAEWEWQNPPSEGYYLRGIWGSSGTDIFAVGCDGGILHYDGSTWSPMSSGTTACLMDVWGSSSTDVFAVGSYYDGDGSWVSATLHYDGSTWSTMEIGTTNSLRGVWGSSGSDVFAVGYGTIRHYDGSTWASMDTETTTGPSSVSLEPVSETISSPMSIVTTAYLDGIWGSSGTDVFAVGGPAPWSPGKILHYDGTTWSAMEGGTTNSLLGVWGSSSHDALAVGLRGTILHYDGSTWSPMSSGTTEYLWGVWGSSGTDVFAVGYYGTILHYDGSTWSPMSERLCRG